MTDGDVRLDVAAELSRDPKVSSEAIVVSADTGTITPHGTGYLRRDVGPGAEDRWDFLDALNDAPNRPYGRYSPRR